MNEPVIHVHCTATSDSVLHWHCQGWFFFVGPGPHPSKCKTPGCSGVLVICSGPYDE